MSHRRGTRQSRRRKDRRFDSIVAIFPRLVEATLTTAVATVVAELLKQLFAHHIV
jgi:hypothetical protein